MKNKTNFPFIMQKIVLLLLLTVAFANTVFASMEPSAIKAKFVMKDKTSFVAIYYSWDAETTDTDAPVQSDKGFQQYLNRESYYITTDKYGKNRKVFQKLVLFKNTYSLKLKKTDEQLSLNTFCSTSDTIMIDVNDILYTVYLSSSSHTQPQIFNDTSAEDMKNNRIVSWYDNYFEACNYLYITTDKSVSTKNKIEAILQQKKIKAKKLTVNQGYFDRIKSELEALKIYIFQECSC